MKKDCTTGRADILRNAEQCVCGDRDTQYGSPEKSFKVISNFWSDYLREKFIKTGGIYDLSSSDVAAMMCLFKIARVATGTSKKDNWIDLAGYAACGGELDTEKNNV